MNRPLHVLVVLLALAAARAAGAAPTPGDLDEDALRSLARGQGPDRSTSLPQGPLLEAPVDPALYRVGPGDRLGVHVLGQASFDFTAAVDPEGWVSLGEFGSVEVAGLSLSEARERIRDRLGRGLRAGEVDVRLAEMRRFKVFVLGEVKEPGAYSMTAASRVSEAVAAAGGSTPAASLRTIEIRREGAAEALPVDLMPFLHAGDTRGNPFLADGDRIVVPTRAGYFGVYGDVAHPGIWDLPAGETLSSALSWIRLLPGADSTRATVARYRESGSTGEFDTLAVDLGPVLDGTGPFPLRDGDRIFVRRLPRYHERYSVRIEGEVRYPGEYPVGPEDRVSLVVERAGGALPEALLSRVALVREKGLPPEVPENMIPRTERGEPDARSFLTGPEARRMSLDLTAGEDALVMDGDRIVVPRREAPVHLAGAVRNPGFYPYREGWRYRDYLHAAGGTTRLADQGSARHVRGVEGTATDAGSGTSIAPGDILYVPEKEPVTTWDRVKDVLIVGVQLATIVIAIDSLNN